MNASVRCIGPPGVDDVGREAQVVLDVAGRQVGVVLALELGEQVLGHLAQRIDQHVQPAAVRHADDHFLHAAGARALHQLVEQRDQRFAAFGEKRFWPT